MPETNKADDFEYGLPNALGIVRERDKRSGQPESPSVELPEQAAAPAAEEVSPPPEPLPEEAEAEVIDDFAQSVMFGLEQAGLGAEQPDTEDAAPIPDKAVKPEVAADQEQGHEHETFFAGWGNETVVPAESKADYQEQLAAEDLDSPPVSPFELSLAASSRKMAANYQESTFDVASKHDALADAVQSALLSLYGDSSSQTARSPDSDIGSSRDFYSNGSSKMAPASREDGTAHGDGLSPQDVILNYFSYSAEGQPEQLSDFDGLEDDPRHQPAETLGPRFSSYSRVQPPPPEAPPHSTYRPPFRGDGTSPAGARYQGMHSFPVPVARAPEPPSGRDSGRLLGAAGIGLVGGIAIAATLAVFVINSYGPQNPSFPFGPEREQEAPRPGPVGSAYVPQENTRGAQGADIRPARSEAPAASEPSDTQGDIMVADTGGVAGQSVALSIAVKSSRPQEQTLISITGVPEGARLNVGVDAGGGNWLLPPRRIDGLVMSLPPDSPSIIPLEVQLLDSNVRTPLSEKKAFTVRVTPASEIPQRNIREAVRSVPTVPTFNTQTIAGPAAKQGGSSAAQEAAFNTQTVRAGADRAAPNSQANALPSLAAVNPSGGQEAKPISQPEIEDLIREGNKRMKEGDILQARDLFLKASSAGDPEAALAMGRSYDPIYFTRLDKKNAEPDPAAAFEWYRKAMDAGATQTARVRIENLKHFLNE